MGKDLAETVGTDKNSIRHVAQLFSFCAGIISLNWNGAEKSSLAFGQLLSMFVWPDQYDGEISFLRHVHSRGRPPDAHFFFEFAL